MSKRFKVLTYNSVSIADFPFAEAARGNFSISRTSAQINKTCDKGVLGHFNTEFLNLYRQSFMNDDHVYEAAEY